jgi:hypothetical protein
MAHFTETRLLCCIIWICVTISTGYSYCVVAGQVHGVLVELVDIVVNLLLMQSPWNLAKLPPSRSKVGHH